MQQAEAATRKRAFNQRFAFISKSKIFFLKGKRRRFNGAAPCGASSFKSAGPPPSFSGALQRKKRRERGQSLIEYLILTALMGVAAIAIVRSLNQTVKSRFANVIYALQGKSQKAKTHSLKKEEYQRSDLSNFMSGAADRKKEKK